MEDFSIFFGNDNIAADYTIGPSLIEGSTEIWLRNEWGRVLYKITFHGKDNWTKAKQWAEEHIKNKQDVNELDPRGLI